MTDQDLARKAQKGDSEAFVELIHRYQNQLYRVVYRFAGSVEQAEDLCQDCMIRAYRQINRFDTQRPFLPWLMRVASNVCLNYAKTLKRQNLLEQPLEEDHHELFHTDTPESQAFARSERQDILDALGRLDENTRLLIVMRFVLGNSFREISEQTGIKLPTVAFRVTKGLERMQKFLKLDAGVIEP